MAEVHLQESVVEGGLRSVNFFNGRVLSGEDLGDERAAQRGVDARLGRATGSGVAYGLFAESSGPGDLARPTLKIRAGLAVAPSGRTLHLPDDVDLLLTRPDPVDARPGEFTTCLPPGGGVYVAGAGVYLLTITCARKAQGRAPVSGLGNGPAPCNSKYIVEGVQFRLIQIPLDGPLPLESQFRNWLAYEVCFGVQDANYTLAQLNPLGLPHPVSPLGYGGTDHLAASGRLSDDEVPLAILYWTATGGIRFVDRWAVRRRLTRPDPGGWPFLSDRRQAEAEAMFYQFQDHLTDLLTDPSVKPDPKAANGLDQVSAYFRWLPPAGLAPTSYGWFQAVKFFKDLVKLPYLNAADARSLASSPSIPGVRLRPLLLESFRYEPLKIVADPKEPLKVDEKLRLQLYRVAGSEAGIETVVFAAENMPYAATARYDDASWDRGRFGPETT